MSVTHVALMNEECKRKGRGSKGNNVARDERKRQRGAAFLLTLQDNTGAGT